MTPPYHGTWADKLAPMSPAGAAAYRAMPTLEPVPMPVALNGRLLELHAIYADDTRPACERAAASRELDRIEGEL